MRAADEADAPYDGDALSQRMDAAFSDLFGRECSALWTATGTAANCLALGTMVQPHGGVVCHREAHIEMDEGGAPGFYLHGAKLMLAEGEGAKLTPDTIRTVIDSVRDGVHQVHPHAISITQASEYGRAYRPEEIVAIADLANAAELPLHMDGARFANAAAFLGCSAAEAAGPVDALSFGCVKNGGMNAEGNSVLRFGARRCRPFPAQACGPFAIEGPLSCRASSGNGGGRSVADQRARR